MKKDMINKRIISILSFVIIALLGINIKTVIDKNEIKKEIEILNIKKKSEQAITSAERTAYLRGLGHVRLHFSPDGHPAFGYKADINTFVRSEDNKVEIIESNEKWIKVNISGWIPKWYLTTNAPKYDEFRYVFPTEKRTVKEDCRLYLTPEENEDVINPELLEVDINSVQLKYGQVVEVIYEYEEWCYVKRYILWDANHYREGWVKKSNLATLEELKPSEIMIKKGTLVQVYDDGYKLTALDENAYGRIEEKKDGWYDVSLPGATIVRVKEEDVTYGN
ncbi:hypothetical protein [Brassicibacter mesophilus]|uniref:hypothetical protein n=1 Tax=Brassicibacter mesophilus TaxID=745119 RepID=UPI003D24509F